MSECLNAFHEPEEISRGLLPLFVRASSINFAERETRFFSFRPPFAFAYSDLFSLGGRAEEEIFSLGPSAKPPQFQHACPSSISKHARTHAGVLSLSPIYATIFLYLVSFRREEQKWDPWDW